VTMLPDRRRSATADRPDTRPNAQDSPNSCRPITRRVLLLTPSRGRGGGIERYAETLEWALAAEGVECRRLDLTSSGPAAHVRLLSECHKQLTASPDPVRILLAHRTLLPVASVLARGHPIHGISVICHGTDVWGTRLQVRRMVEKHLLRSSRVRVVAASSFTAGVLFGSCQATILPPGLSQAWFEKLVSASVDVRKNRLGVELVTAFRLADWRDKGLVELLDAVGRIGRADVRVVVCGTGAPPAELQQLVRAHPLCRLRSELTDDDLAFQLASADLCVLATRTRFGRAPYGEGFGLVLLEAQVAGTPVIAPAHGGSHDAYVQGVTGLAPADESPEALRRVLEEAIRQPDRLSQMSREAAAWSRRRFAPDMYAALAVERLL
jgi:phosphatidyl-myo-inositol dimannoside synthase